MNELPENIARAQERVKNARAKLVLAVTTTFHKDQRITWQDGRAVKRYGCVLMVYTRDCHTGDQLFVRDDQRDGAYWININSTCSPRPDYLRVAPYPTSAAPNTLTKTFKTSSSK